MPISSSSFIRATIVLLLAGVITVVAIVMAALWIAGRNDTQADELIEAQRLRREAFIALTLVLDAETGQRGYLLTRDAAYLEPYSTAVDEIGQALTRLRDNAKTQPRYAPAIGMYVAAIEAKLAELSETVELAKAGRQEEAIAVVRTDRGKELMDAARAAADSLIDSTDVTVRADTAALRESSRLLLWVLAAGGFVIIGVVGATSFVAWRYTRDLERARTEVMALNTTLEARVRERTADVVRANEETQRFAYIVSHDLRSPLVNIMGFTSELERGLADVSALLPPPSKDEPPAIVAARSAIVSEMPEAFRFIRAATNRMDRLIEAILKLSREGRRRFSPERVDMAKFFETAAGSVRPQLPQGGEISVVSRIPDLVTDRLAVEQVFSNLIDNAVKYLEPDRPSRIVIRGDETPMGVVFEVEDNGRGIAPEDHERIFELFRRAGAQDRQGEGIGLSHVKALVRRLNGTISLRSELGRGTTFRVRLPKTLTIVETE